MAYSRKIDSDHSDVLVKYSCGHRGAIASPGVADPGGFLREKVLNGSATIHENDEIGYAEWPYLCSDCFKDIK